MILAETVEIADAAHSDGLPSLEQMGQCTENLGLGGLEHVDGFMNLVQKFESSEGLGAAVVEELATPKSCFGHVSRSS